MLPSWRVHVRAHISSGLEFSAELISESHTDLIRVCGRNLIVDGDLECARTQLKKHWEAMIVRV